MFTGIIQYVGTLQTIRPLPGGRRLGIEIGPLAESLRPGQSIAVNGACLTAADVGPGRAEFDVVRETLDRTNLGRLASGARVNLEPALALGGALDGHLVQGHVDALAEVREVQRGGDWVTRFSADRELTDQMVSKGSVALNGVSLTLAEVGQGHFATALIPTTLGETNLAGLAVGEAVNVETDLIGKYVRKHLESMAGPGGAAGLSLDKLRDAGFA